MQEYADLHTAMIITILASVIITVNTMDDTKLL